MKKILRLNIILLMLISIFLPLNQAQSENIDITDRVTVSEITVKNSSGSEVLSGEQNQTGASPETKLNVLFSGKYDASALGSTIKEGYYFNVKAPDYLDLIEGEYSLIHEEAGVQLGVMRAVSASKTLIFTFNKNVEDQHSVKGTFNATASVKLKQGENQFTWPDGTTYKVNYKYEIDPLARFKVKEEGIFKMGYNSNTDSLGWQVRVNRAKKDYGTANVKIRDAFAASNESLSAFIESSFVLKKVTFNDAESLFPEVVSEEDVTLTTDRTVFEADTTGNVALLSFFDGKTSFEINLGNKVGTNSYILSYRSTNPNDKTAIRNGVMLLVNDQAQVTFSMFKGRENSSTVHSQSQVAEAQAGGTVESDLSGRIKITKYDADDASILLDNVVFTVTKTDDSSVSYDIVTNAKGIAVTPELQAGNYSIVEKRTKQGYILDVTPRTVTMPENRSPVRLNISNKKGETSTETTTSTSANEEVETSTTTNTHVEVETSTTTGTNEEVETSTTTDTHVEVETSTTINTHVEVETSTTIGTNEEAETSTTIGTNEEVETSTTIGTNEEVEISTTIGTNEEAETSMTTGTNVVETSTTKGVTATESSHLTSTASQEQTNSSLVDKSDNKSLSREIVSQTKDMVKSDKVKEELPYTGTVTSIIVTILGIVLLGVAGVLLFFKRAKI